MADITITEGDTLEVDYTLENTGDGTGTFDPRLLVQGVQEDQDTGITLDPAQTATGTLSWVTQDGDAVTDALAEAVTDDTSDSILVTVNPYQNIVDDFEDGNLSEYTAVAGNFETRNTNVPEGNVAFGNASDAGVLTLIHSLDGTGLNYYPQKGDVFSVLLRETASGETNIPKSAFGLFDDAGTIRGYGVLHFPGNNEIQIIEIDGTGFTTLQSASVTLSRGDWYDYEIEWHDGTGTEADNEIVLNVYEVDTSLNLSRTLGRTSQIASIQVNDTQYPNDRGIGFGNQTSAQQAATIADRYWHLGGVE